MVIKSTLRLPPDMQNLVFYSFLDYKKVIFLVEKITLICFTQYFIYEPPKISIFSFSSTGVFPIHS